MGEIPMLRPAHWRAALTLLQQIVEQSRSADASLQAWTREHRNMGSRDRAQLGALVYGVLRDAQRLRAIAEAVAGETAGVERWLAIHVLDRGLADAAALAALSRESVAAQQALAQHDPQTLPVAARHNVPAAVWARWCTQYGEEDAAALARALNREATVDLRTNTLKTDRERLRIALETENLVAVPTPLSPLGLRMSRRAPLAATRAFRDGLFEPQDEGSQLLAQLVDARPGERIADFCAGAGGKTLALGAAMQNRGELWALDISRSRLERLPPRAARAGLRNLQLCALPDPRWLQQHEARFDAVLVDAPCSGTGTWRRNPELRLRALDLPALAAQQGAILRDAARLVRPGGRLVYATCSLLADENQAVIADWQAQAPEFRLQPAAERLPWLPAQTASGSLLLLPQRDDTDGFFAACFIRAA